MDANGKISYPEFCQLYEEQQRILQEIQNRIWKEFGIPAEEYFAQFLFGGFLPDCEENKDEMVLAKKEI